MNQPIYKTPIQQAESLSKPDFAFSDDHLNNIGLALKKPADQDIDLGDGLSLFISKPTGYRSWEERANATIDILDNNNNSIIDTLEVFGTDFDDDYRKEVLEKINNYRRR